MLIQKIKCEKCGHERIPRTENPIKCSVCGHVPGAKIRKASVTVSQTDTPADKPTDQSVLNNEGGFVNTS